MHANLSRNQDSYAQQENDEIFDLLQATSSLVDEDTDDETVGFNDDLSFPPVVTSVMMSDNDINESIRSLNCKQRYNIINKWAREHTKNRTSLIPSVIKSLYLFITGKGSCG